MVIVRVSSSVVRGIRVVQAILVWWFAIAVVLASTNGGWLRTVLLVATCLGFVWVIYRVCTSWLQVSDAGVSWRGVMSSGSLDWSRVERVDWAHPSLGTAGLDFKAVAPRFRSGGMWPKVVGPVPCAAFLRDAEVVAIDSAIEDACKAASIPYSRQGLVFG
jgi:hypothetical protein